jgi:hypothetical protein
VPRSAGQVARERRGLETHGGKAGTNSIHKGVSMTFKPNGVYILEDGEIIEL